MAPSLFVALPSSLDTLINPCHILINLLSQFITGGRDQYDVSTRYIPPTVVKVEMDDALMQDETFGPILAVSRLIHLDTS
jgi:hypothetical protein